MFEGDYLQVVKAVSSYKPSEDDLSSILHDIHYMMQWAKGWQVLHDNWESYRIAHCLVKLDCKELCESI